MTAIVWNVKGTGTAGISIFDEIAVMIAKRMANPIFFTNSRR
jgi:hypothetical protein